MNLPTELPLFPLGSVLFPGEHLPLHVFEERYRKLMRDHFNHDPIFGVVLTETGMEVADEPTIHRVGTAARLIAASEFPDGRMAIVVQGSRRFQVMSSSWESSFLVGSVEWLDDDPIPTPPEMTDRLIDEFVAYLRAGGAASADPSSIDELEIGLRSTFTGDLNGLTYLIAAQMPLNTWHRQRILEISSSDGRFRNVRTLIRQERVILEQAGATTGLTGLRMGSILPN